MIPQARMKVFDPSVDAFAKIEVRLVNTWKNKYDITRSIHMDEITFEWDTQKAQKNYPKHGISFEEAETAFYDPNARTSYDPDHSQDEDRYILLGMSESFKLIVVCHVYRQNDESIRIISARRATKTEQKEYKGYLI